MLRRLLGSPRRLSSRDVVLHELIKEYQAMRKEFTDAMNRVDTALASIPERVQNATATALQNADTEGTEMTNAATALASRVEAGVARIGPLTSTGTVETGAGGSSIFGGQGGDSINPGQGGDSINAGQGGSSVFGGQGNDTLDIGSGDVGSLSAATGNGGQSNDAIEQ